MHVCWSIDSFAREAGVQFCVIFYTSHNEYGLETFCEWRAYLDHGPHTAQMGHLSLGLSELLSVCSFLASWRPARGLGRPICGAVARSCYLFSTAVPSHAPGPNLLSPTVCNLGCRRGGRGAGTGLGHGGQTGGQGLCRVDPLPSWKKTCRKRQPQTSRTLPACGAWSEG